MTYWHPSHRSRSGNQSHSLKGLNNIERRLYRLYSFTVETLWKCEDILCSRLEYRSLIKLEIRINLSDLRCLWAGKEYCLLTFHFHDLSVHHSGSDISNLAGISACFIQWPDHLSQGYCCVVYSCDIFLGQLPLRNRHVRLVCEV